MPQASHHLTFLAYLCCTTSKPPQCISQSWRPLHYYKEWTDSSSRTCSDTKQMFSLCCWHRLDCVRVYVGMCVCLFAPKLMTRWQRKAVKRPSVDTHTDPCLCSPQFLNTELFRDSGSLFFFTSTVFFSCYIYSIYNVYVQYILVLSYY